MGLYALRGSITFEVDTLIEANSEASALRLAATRAVVSVFDSEHNPSALRTWISGNPQSGAKVENIAIVDCEVR